MDNNTFAQAIADGEGLDEAQQAMVKKLLDSNLTATDGFKEYAVRNGLATTEELQYPDPQGAYAAYMMGRFVGSDNKMKEALRNPESTFQMLNQLTLPSKKQMFKQEGEPMAYAALQLEQFDTPEKVQDVQTRLGVNSDGIAGQQTQTALANLISVYGQDALQQKPNKRQEERMGGFYTRKDGVKVYNSIQGDFGDAQGFIQHLASREGVVYQSYNDSLGKLTAGVGHLLTEEEQKKYPKGTQIPQSQVQVWLKQDTSKAIKAAKAQAKELGIKDSKFVEALASVNFQLGTEWATKFPSAWENLKAKDYVGAIAEVQYVKEGSRTKSDWNKQTPERVNDFVSAIKQLMS
jgi:GH24 family phage-related lysozyme (muramidase)